MWIRRVILERRAAGEPSWAQVEKRALEPGQVRKDGYPSPAQRSGAPWGAHYIH